MTPDPYDASLPRRVHTIRRLHDAAPDMLAALKHAIAVDAEWRRKHGDAPRTPEYQESYDMVLAAIAKAEGRQTW